MIPIRLKMKGVYSYKEEMNIDFTELTAAGLFGIVGGVGSGKSAIIEAITYALYGRLERLGHSGLNYNFMNLQSNKATVEFEFKNYENKTFKVTIDVSRNLQNRRQIYTPERVFYKKIESEWVSQENINANQIIGVNYDNFKRTIIIPQGHFREFLELTGGERSKMMKEIFHLHRFDLSDNVTALRSANQTKLDQRAGELRGLEDINDELLKVKEQTLETINDQLEKDTKEFEVIDSKFRQLTRLKESYNQMLKRKQEFTTLEKEKPSIDQLRDKVVRYERFYRLFNQDLVQLDETKTALAKEQKQLGVLESKIKDQAEHITQKTKQLDEIKPHYNVLNQKRTEVNDLENIVRIIRLQTTCDKESSRIIDKEKYVKDAESEFTETQSRIKEIENDIRKLEKQLIDLRLLDEVGQWFNENNNLIRIINDNSENLRRENQELLSLQKQLNQKEVNPETFDEENKKENQKLEEHRSKFQQQQADLQLQHRLSEFTSELHKRKACPLCGSLDHPSILQINDVTGEQKKVSKAIEDINVKINQLNNFARVVRDLITQLNHQERIVSNLQVDLETSKSNHKNHLNLFKWEQFNPNNPVGFNKMRDANHDLNNEIGEKRTFLQDENRALEQKRTALDKANNQLQTIKNEVNGLKIRVKEITDNLRVLKLDSYIDKPESIIEQKLNNLKQLNDKVEKEHQQLTDAINKTRTSKAANDALKKNTEELIADNIQREKTLSNSLQKKLLQENVESLDIVRSILKEKIDVEKERADISKFEQEYATTKSALNELKARLKAASYDHSQYPAAKASRDEAEEKLQTLRQEVAVLKTDVERNKKRLNEKLKLLKDLEELEKRRENLDKLRTLFEGQRFVNYISTIYLTQLLSGANKHFERMTRNRLQLQLNEKNEFEVIDFLNDGHTRSVKTLSGGQAFQASLSLALALAESVQTYAAAEKNFFFIDEGFGTQDEESINIVFETLQSLKDENKIVGIISHVEELKERVPITLTVTKDDEHGSRIQLNR